MSKTARVRPTGQSTEESSQQAQACDECGGSVVEDGVEQICQDCGLVVGEDTIDHGAEWRHDDTAERARAGTAVDRTRHDNGFSTRIGVDAVVEQLSITERRLFDTIDRLREEIGVALPLASPRMYVTRYVNDLDGEARTETVAREVAAAADEAGLTANGAAPSAVAAGCVYEAFIAAQWEAKRFQPDVGDVAGVSGRTVRRHWQRLQEAGIDGGQVDV